MCIPHLILAVYTLVWTRNIQRFQSLAVVFSINQTCDIEQSVLLQTFQSLLSAPMRELYLRVWPLFIWSLIPAIGEDLLSCETTSPDASGYRCRGNEAENHCSTFVVLRTNSYFSSLYNLSFYLGLNRFDIGEANGFSAETEFLPKDQLLLIPMKCSCKNGVFQADVRKATVKGESFYGISVALEGLTTCNSIRKNNPGISPWGLQENTQILVPLRCACPDESELNQKARILVTYPVSQGESIANLTMEFNSSAEDILFANKNRSLSGFDPQILVPFTSILIPQNGKPLLGTVAKPTEPNMQIPPTEIPLLNGQKRKKKSRMWKIGLAIAVGGVVVGAAIAVAAVYLVFYLKKKKQQQRTSKDADVELQQLSLSIRTASDKKVSFEGSQSTLDGQIIETPPRKWLMEAFSFEDLRKATEDFNSSNHIEGTVYHGRLNGNSIAIRRIPTEQVGKVELGLLNGATRQHTNILRMLGTCVAEGPNSYLVFEYARNGSLKDWLHGGLAMKSQFIASCYCFLSWSQRLKICLDVAVALHCLHQIVSPSYVHRNVKSRNIFLDEDFSAKIGNFGMARFVEDHESGSPDLSSNPATWSLGYLAPEYIHQGVVSPSMDIFAYGVVLLEVLSGQTPTSRPDKGGGSVWLSEKIRTILASENADHELKEWIDGALGENYSFDAVLCVAKIAKSCTEEDPKLRPNAGEIVDKLSKLGEESAGGEHMLESETESSCKPLIN